MIMDLLEHGHLLTASELAQAAQEARHSSGLSQQEAARRLGVAQATLAQAESAPKRSLQALRSRMVAELSAGMEVSGPYFVVKHRGMSLRDGVQLRRLIFHVQGNILLYHVQLPKFDVFLPC